MTPRRPTSPESGRLLATERGSMLLTAMLFAIALAVVLGSYLTLSRTTLKVAHRSYFANDATNLTEAGLEEALYRFNLMGTGTAPATAWTGWTISGNNASFTLPTFNRDQNAIGIVKVYVIGYNGSTAAPMIIAQATITPFYGGAPVMKTVQLALKYDFTPHYGLVALSGLTLNNTTFADSFNSNPSNSPTGPWAAYPGTGATSRNTTVVLAGSVTVATALGIKGDLKLGTGVATPAGKYTGTLTTGYSAAFPLPVYPTAGSVSQSYNLAATIPATLPRGGDLPAADGRYYYFCSGATIGTVAITAGKNVTIVGTTTGMSTGLTIGSLGSCIIYMDKPVVLASGKTINDTNWAGALQIYTNTAVASTFANNSRITACLYMPLAALTATGAGASSTLTGYFVAKTITASNAQAFHFDEALLSTGNIWKPAGWLELQSAADKATVAGRTGSFLQ
jgi:hypothetical protein